MSLSQDPTGYNDIASTHLFIMPDPYSAASASPEVRAPLRQALASLHYAYPVTVFLYYLVTSTIAVCTLQTMSSEQNHSRRRAITWLLGFVIATYFAQLLVLAIHGFVRHTSPPADQDTIISLLSCALAFGVVFAGLSGAEHPVWYPYMGSFVVALVFEPLVETLSLVARPPGLLTSVEALDISIVAARYLSVALALAFYLEGNRSSRREKGTDSERQSLLQTNGHAGDASDADDQTDGNRQSSYGATSGGSADSGQSSESDSDDNPYERRQRQASEKMEKRLKEKGNWVTYAKSFMVCDNPAGFQRKSRLDCQLTRIHSGVLPLYLAGQPQVAPNTRRACRGLPFSHECRQPPDSAAAGYHHGQSRRI